MLGGGEPIFGIHVVIYSNRIKLHELFELASRARRNISLAVGYRFYFRDLANFFLSLILQPLKKMSSEFDADTVSAPRLVVMKRGEGGYGFNLHGERNVQAGQTISAVDNDSEAQKAGLRVGDKVVEVNGANVEKMSHSDVVKRIKMNQSEVSMLVIDHITEAYLKQEGRDITADMANLMTVYQPKEVASEPEAPAAVVQDSVTELQESNVEESASPPPETLETANGTRDEEVTPEAEIGNEATTPEEVKQLNDVLDNEDSSSPPEPTPTPEPTTVQTNGTEDEPPTSPPAPTPVPTPAPAPVSAPSQPTRPTSKPLRSTIKQQKAESWDEKYRKFQQL